MNTLMSSSEMRAQSTVFRFFERLEQEHKTMEQMSTIMKSSTRIIMIIDKFKTCNKTNGHFSR